MFLQVDGRQVLTNHLRFTILYHKDPETEFSRIVGFEVEPFSVHHKYEGKWNADRPELSTCSPGSMKFVTERDQKQELVEGVEVIFTYDVLFKVRLGGLLRVAVFSLSLQLLKMQLYGNR